MHENGLAAPPVSDPECLTATGAAIEVSQGDWVNQERLPHLLHPGMYSDAVQYSRELEHLFMRAWHPIATTHDLPRSGDFRTLEILGTPLIVRNDGGEFSTFLNSCVHRHAKLTSVARGHQPRLQCQYHGWEYDRAGCVRKVPDGSCFKPLVRRELRLHAFPTATCGKLIFVSLVNDGPSLETFLGQATEARIRESFSDDFAQADAWETDHSANWKVPIENSLECYHIPIVHPKTFGVLPDKAGVGHTLAEKHTAYQHVYRVLLWPWLQKKLNRLPEFTYVHHHAFPHIAVAHSPYCTYMQVVYPTSPQTSHIISRLFVRLGDPRRRIERFCARWMLRPIARRLARTVFAEDGRLFSDIQRGLEASRAPGVIGTREERIYTFQRYVLAQTQRRGS